MLVLKRKEGQWTEIVHRSGDVLRVRAYDITDPPDRPGTVNLAFDDDARNFEIKRPERRVPLALPDDRETRDAAIRAYAADLVERHGETFRQLAFADRTAPGPEADGGFEPAAAAELANGWPDESGHGAVS